jgi:membrane protein YdbS with pleckstrin-like domain
MGIDGIGSSVIIALAAVLWFLYLVPTWLKRREYLATERNAVRLQQTMRIMAESAELPAVVRVEATARSVAAQERALRKQQKLARRVPFPVERAARLPFPEERAARLEGNPRRLSSAPDDFRRLSSARSARIETRLAARRLRRSRALASLVLLVSLVAAGFGVSELLATGSWMLLAASVVVGFGALALLGQAASVSRARSERVRSAAPPAVATFHDEAEYQVAPRSGWTPVPVPRPLYLSRSDAAGADDRRLSSARSARIETTSRGNDHRDGDGGHPFTASGETEPVGGGGGKAHRGADRVGEGGLRLVASRPEPRPLADGLDRHVRDLEPGVAHQA